MVASFRRPFHIGARAACDGPSCGRCRSRRPATRTRTWSACSLCRRANPYAIAGCHSLQLSSCRPSAQQSHSLPGNAARQVHVCFRQGHILDRMVLPEGGRTPAGPTGRRVYSPGLISADLPRVACLPAPCPALSRPCRPFRGRRDRPSPALAGRRACCRPSSSFRLGPPGG